MYRTTFQMDLSFVQSTKLLLNDKTAEHKI